ncbi:MAG: alpha-L-arabinofuranosidase C-terminal domain-containing protein, partial [Verrucomicrobiota bacterium]
MVVLASHPSTVSAFTIDAGRPAGKVSPMLYGLMTEEINHSYDGGLYAELIQNRAFLDSTNSPLHWSVASGHDSSANIALDPANPLNDQLTTSLRLDVFNAAKGRPAGVANDGYWGIPVQPKTTYHAAIWVKAAASGLGPMAVSIVSEDGSTVYAAGKISQLAADWNRYEVTLKTGSVTPTDRAKFTLSLEQPGTIWLGLVSLFPPTWNDRPNGLRKDLMQMLVDLKPKFLRFPGGNYLEGDNRESRFQWKKTLGPIAQRAGHLCPWGYRSSDGMGLMEFLLWSQDMGAEPVLAVYAGYSLDGKYIKAGPDLEPFVRDALDEIEYVIGDTNTTWGAQRAKDGHPAPFPLHYVEIGNEDWFDKAKTYDARYTQFHDAIKAKCPQLKLISTVANDQPDNMRVHSRKPDMLDEHYYCATDEFLQKSRTYGQNMDRSGPEVFVGEWAAHEDAAIKPWEPGARKQPPTPTMKAALGDALFMAAMERNSDIIKMHCYAPLLVNVNPGARQWRPDLIGYDAISSYASPSYYAIQMFSRNVGDEILQVRSEENEIQGCATRNSKTGEIIIKLVNPADTNVVVTIAVKGIASLSSQGSALVLQGSPED